MQLNTAQAVKSPLFFFFRFLPAERKVFERKEKLTPSEWAAKNRVVSIGAHKGPWRNDVSPHLVEIMDTWALPHVREVILCKSPQSGGSETINNCAAYALERDPSVMLFIMPSQADARKVAVDRLIPMIKASPRLVDLMSPNPDDTAAQRIKFSNGALIHMAWSNSASALATFPVKYLFFDEVDKYPSTVGKETDPITLGEKRARTFSHTHKIFKVSTPTREDGPIWRAYQGADVQYEYYAICPACDVPQVMEFSQLKWPAEIPAEEIRREKHARYECDHCQALWTDNDRDHAISAGYWLRNKGHKVTRPRSVAYHLLSFISPDVSLSEIAAAFLRSKDNVVKLIDFHNDYLAEPYIALQSERKEDQVLLLRDDRPRGIVPDGIACLIASVDTQARGFYYEVRAWGYGYDMDSWQVREGFIENFTGLVKILCDDTYKDIAGNEYKILLTLIDSGGGMGDYGVSRTAEVYDFCRRFRNIIPIKGQQRMSQPHKSTQLDVFPGTNKPIPGGLNLYNLNVTHYKDYLASKLMIAPEDAGAWRLHSEATAEYARQMTAEFKDEKGIWQCPRKRSNHYWDLSVYNLAAADILGVKYFKNPNIPQEGKKDDSTQVKKTGRPKTGRW